MLGQMSRLDAEPAADVQDLARLPEPGISSHAGPAGRVYQDGQCPLGNWKGG